ncbi:metallophosphoesterase [Crassaminicella profunda]|uniref:metallophosphoesterase n=1 Tax=Crassaminicella profunda TaxID=1286698 RepID=UPI001CA5F9BB|nr:metallophosphoesterase [Crassaminicella profunda]QZY54056.1 metallophosphoesterase [Crassaminicella profunda]
MKIVVMSDTHGKIELAEYIIAKIEEIDLLIHLGDYYPDALALGKNMNLKVVGVKGNCDRAEIENEKVLDLGEYKLFLTHGHQYGVKSNLSRIYYKGLEEGCNIVLFGHTHMPVNIKHEDVLIMNPGSLTSPRGGSKASYGIIEMDGKNMKSHIVEV